MMRLMSKLLIVTLISSSLVFAKEVKKDDIQESVVNYIKGAVSVNKDFNLKDIRVRQSKPLEGTPGWSVYFLDIDLEVKSQNNRVMTVHDKIFTDGKLISRDFIEIATKLSLKDKMAPDMDDSFYRKDRLLYGDESAKDKIVVFSDPICPSCQSYIPELLKAVKSNPKKVALYYYHFPLTMMHPAAPAIIKATLALKKSGQKDAVIKLYEQKFKIDSKDEQKVLDEFNKKMGSKLTLEDINTQDILKHYSEDLELAGKMMINSTPTVYVNGQKDFTRNKYKEILGIK